MKNITVFLFPRTSDECRRTKPNVKKNDRDPIKMKRGIEVKDSKLHNDVIMNRAK
jgi:hypothetical protein